VVDLDLQGIAFSNAGKLIDAVYFNNLKALRGALTHSGDEITGAKQGFDEMIWVHFPRLAAEVHLICFVVSCYRGGSLRDARNGKLHLLEDVLGHEVGKFNLTQANGRSVMVGGVYRGAGGWTFRMVEEAVNGQHFIDILEPTIGNFVRQLIPSAPRRIKAAFAMEKGSVVDLPRSNEIQQTVAGLGWDTTMGEVDIDVSAVLLDRNVQELECVFFGNEETQGIKHSGDNLTGHGSGDDETITIDLQALHPAVDQIVFVVNIYSKGTSFAQVANPYCRLVNAGGEEFCRYQLKEAGNEQALIMARLFRPPGGIRWSFQAIGAPCKGQTYKDSMPAVIKYARAKPSDLAATRSLSAFGSSLDLGAGGADGGGEVTVLEGADRTTGCGGCSVQ